MKEAVMINHHLKTFIAAADSGSFIKAGAELFISPNAVAKQITLLENHLQLKLFIRTRQGLKLTPEGAYIYNEAKKMIEWSDKVLKNVRSIPGSEGSVIRVGTSLMNPYHILQKRWLQVASQAPEITLQVEPYRDDLIEFQNIMAHLGDKIDVIPCLYDEGFCKGRCHVLHLDEQPARMGVPTYHPLAWKPCLGRKDLNGQTILVMKGEANPTLAKIKQELLSLCSGVTIEETDLIDYHVFNRAVNENKLIVTAECWKDVHPMIRSVPVGWSHEFRYGVIYPLEPTAVVQRFIDLLCSDSV